MTRPLDVAPERLRAIREAADLSPTELGAVLRAMREAAGLTPTELGAAIGVSAQLIWRWENASGGAPSDRRLIQLAVVCRVPPLELFAPDPAGV